MGVEAEDRRCVEGRSRLPPPEEGRPARRTPGDPTAPTPPRRVTTAIGRVGTSARDDEQDRGRARAAPSVPVGQAAVIGGAVARSEGDHPIGDRELALALALALKNIHDLLAVMGRPIVVQKTLARLDDVDRRAAGEAGRRCLAAWLADLGRLP